MFVKLTFNSVNRTTVHISVDADYSYDKVIAMR